MLSREEIDRAIAGAARRLVEACGGQESAAAIPGIRVTRHQSYSEYGQEGHSNRLPLDVLVMLTIDSRSPAFLDWLARQIGRVVVLQPEAPAGASLNRVTGQALKETSDIFARLGSALDDGQLDVGEVRDLDREIDEAIDKLLVLRAHVDAAGGER